MRKAPGMDTTVNEEEGDDNSTAWGVPDEHENEIREGRPLIGAASQALEPSVKPCRDTNGPRITQSTRAAGIPDTQW